MTLQPQHRQALLGLGAAALLLALVFLFVKTNGIEFKGDLRALRLLSEMKDIDARWDSDALRLANEVAASKNPVPDRSALLARVLRELEEGTSRTAIAQQVPAIRAALTQKDAVFKDLRKAHDVSLRTLENAREALRSLLAESAVARARDPRSAERAATLTALAIQVRTGLIGTDVTAMDENAAELAPRVASLRAAAVAADPAMGIVGGNAQAAAEGYLNARVAEGAAWRKFSFLTVGGRIDLTARNLSKSIEETLDDKERWRVYLFAYAGALLIGVGYLATRVLATQQALRNANEDLEKRVSERTRDLSQTLKRLKESEAQLVQSEKMSSLGQMVAGVAHEINTPLAYVKNSVATARDRIPDLHGMIEQAERLLAILRAESPDPDELNAAFGALETLIARLRAERAIEDLDTLTGDGLHGIEQIAELVANLKNFSRLDRSKVASFNVNDGVHATLLIARPNLRKIDVEKHLGDVPSITCSPSQVNQVLLNLINNSTQAIDKPRGLITVTTRPLGTTAPAIDVEDNGKGIAPEALPKIFDPFYTTKEVGKGTGLGLSIAYKIVSQHAGKIDVRSTQGVGTTVTVTLPVEPPPELAMATEEAAAEGMR